MLDLLSIKYFKMVVDPASIRKDTPDEVQANCPVCGDRKHRLHLYRPKGFDQDVVHCFNEGCELAEKHHNMVNFLKIAKPELVDSYKRENLQTIIKNVTNTIDVQDILTKIEKTTGLTQTKENDKKRELPLGKLFMKCKDNQTCLDFVKKRGIEPRDDWYFSEDKFFTWNQKTVFLENYLIIPIYSDQKYKGFYSRSVKEKKFSTFLLPDIEKVWTSSPDVGPENMEILCEGVFDSLSTSFEKSGAMLSASVSEEYIEKLNPNCIIALDNDKTGIEKTIKYAERGFNVFVWPEIEEKDFNEVLQNGYTCLEIKKIIQENTYKSYDAIVRLKMKEI